MCTDGVWCNWHMVRGSTDETTIFIYNNLFLPGFSTIYVVHRRSLMCTSLTTSLLEATIKKEQREYASIRCWTNALLLRAPIYIYLQASQWRVGPISRCNWHKVRGSTDETTIFIYNNLFLPGFSAIYVVHHTNKLLPIQFQREKHWDVLSVQDVRFQCS